MSDSLAARGSDEAASSWLKKEIARTDALIAAIPGGAKGVEEARARAVEENREEAEELRLLREQTPGLIADVIYYKSRVVELEACAMLVRDNDNLRKRVAELEAQQSSLREKIEALRAEARRRGGDGTATFSVVGDAV
jgi:uncharacterized protein YhaN